MNLMTEKRSYTDGKPLTARHRAFMTECARHLRIHPERMIYHAQGKIQYMLLFAPNVEKACRKFNSRMAEEMLPLPGEEVEL